MRFYDWKWLGAGRRATFRRKKPIDMTSSYSCSCYCIGGTILHALVKIQSFVPTPSSLLNYAATTTSSVAACISTTRPVVDTPAENYRPACRPHVRTRHASGRSPCTRTRVCAYARGHSIPSPFCHGLNVFPTVAFAECTHFNSY